MTTASDKLPSDKTFGLFTTILFIYGAVNGILCVGLIAYLYIE